jgi:predicted secreted hydrolase
MQRTFDVSQTAERLGLWLVFWAVLCVLPPVAAASTTPSAREAPLGIPLPGKLTPEDVSSTSSEGGDLRGRVPGAGACTSAPKRGISLPADDRPHNDTYLEWWWWRGSLVAADGRRFGFTFTFASKPWARVYGTDFSLTDLSTRTFHYGRQPVIVGTPKPLADGFVLRGDHARATGGNGRDRLQFDVDGHEVELSLKPSKPAVAQLGDGYFTAYCNYVYLYSRVRMRVTGTLEQGGRPVRVTGTSTFDHSWGFSPLVEVASWDWLTLGLDDGRDVFLLVVRGLRNRKQLPVDVESIGDLYTGSISNRRGRVKTLHRGDFTITPTRYWRRDPTCTYPVEWDVNVKGERLHIRASLDTTEVRAIRDPAAFTLWPVYWDGETIITGSHSGRGWMDTKYCLV